MPNAQDYVTQAIVPFFDGLTTLETIIRSIDTGISFASLKEFSEYRWSDSFTTVDSRIELVQKCKIDDYADLTNYLDRTNIGCLDLYCYFSRMGTEQLLLQWLKMIADDHSSGTPSSYPYTGFSDEEFMSLGFGATLSAPGVDAFHTTIAGDLAAYAFPWSGTFEVPSSVRKLADRQMIDVVAMICGKVVD